MATAILGLYPDVRMECPGIAEPVLQIAVREAIQEFFRESEAWKYTIPTALNWTAALTFPTIAAGTEIPTGTRVKRVDTVKYASDGSNFVVVSFKTRDELDRAYPDWEVQEGSSPKCWTNDNDGQARIIPIAEDDVNSSLRLRAIIVPTDALTELPDFLYEEFKEALKAGAKARLMAQPGRDWTNTQLASHYKRVFEDAKTKAKSRAEAGYGQPSGVMAYGGL